MVPDDDEVVTKAELRSLAQRVSRLATTVGELAFLLGQLTRVVEKMNNEEMKNGEPLEREEAD